MTENQELWLALDVTVNSQAVEATEFALNEIGALGTEINLLGKPQPQAETCVTGYFNEKPSEEILQNQLDAALRIYEFSRDAIKKIEWREVENKDWLAEWKKHWRPTETARFIIAPPWEKIGNTDKIVIRIEPNMAFGTGTHETTRLCLKAIEENYAGESFLDVGTGTGILAIAAAKLAERANKKTAKFLGCDTDADSIKIAVENAKLNGADKIKFYVGSIGENTPGFNFVCANLTADVIIPMLPVLISKTKKRLLLSGILKQQHNLVTSEISKFQISNFKIATEGEWISILVVNGEW